MLTFSFASFDHPDASLKISSISGESLGAYSCAKGKTTVEVPVGNLNSGTYLYIVEMGETVARGKFIKL